jgi:hypothetical protein
METKIGLFMKASNMLAISFFGAAAREFSCPIIPQDMMD